MADINDLRKLAKKRQRAVGQKISRIRRQVGVELGNTNFDPRKSITDINKMSGRSLRRFIKSLDSFQQRKVQFVPLAGNKFAPRVKWKQFVREQDVVNRLANEFSSAINPVPLPDQPKPGEGFVNTIGTQKAMLATSAIPRMAGEANVPFNRHTIEPSEVRSLKALIALERRARNQSSPGYLERQVKNYRDRVDKALQKMSGSEMMREDFDSLNDFQFMVLWEKPGAFERFFTKYESMQKRTTETIDSDDELSEFGTVGRSATKERGAVEPEGLFKWASNVERPDDSPI